MQVSVPDNTQKTVQNHLSRTPLAAAILLACQPAMAQETLEEVLVTAQKRVENLQDVPISIQSLGAEALEELNLKDFKQYVAMLPSVAMTPSLGAGSGFNLVYMRGIATAGDGQATTSQPSVGMYLDEQPITTIQGNLDVHMYDIARVEALAGPQGTLYGASSQAGTIRVITNKPDPSGFSAGYGVEGTLVDNDDKGHVLEGFVNYPLNDHMALRVVGWSRSDAGYVDNVQATRTFPGYANTTADDIVLDNAAFAGDNYNTIHTLGARAALRVDLNDNWSATPNVMVQNQRQQGSWGEDMSAFVSGENEVSHFKEEFTTDQWYQLGLTIEGRVGNFDLTYSGSYLNRDVDGSFDYSDYSYWYDTVYTTGYYSDLHFSDSGTPVVPNQFYPTAGERIMTGARFTNNDYYTKNSHELRINSPADSRLRGMLGFFWQHQYHDFEQRWMVEGLSQSQWLNQDEPNGTQFPDTVYLNSLDRNDRDRAVFGHLSFDITDSLELTAGMRFFKPEVTVNGFFGFGASWSPWSGTGEGQCADQTESGGDKPCINVDKGISESESIGRVNLSWDVNDDVMLYATWSEGYRPGGINRRPGADNYISDFLTNIEAGWKTQWFGNRLQFNGAIFNQEWEDFQVSFVGANAITQVANGPTADVAGIETQLQWLPTENLRLSGSFAFYDSELQDDYCPGCNSDGSAWAPAGTGLPITADFKGNVVGRYSFDMGGRDGYFQTAVSHEGERGSSLNQAENLVRGEVPANTFVDLALGYQSGSHALELFVKNATDEDAPLFLTSQCAVGTCGSQIYGVRARPRTIGLRFSQDF